MAAQQGASRKLPQQKKWHECFVRAAAGARKA
eukprot:CAMPEP_0178446180 /NCGR_PEP_ID=MMETSP0689_2-20121128/40643_1 /TAXON_ID=160604 /ORGANISM="Amphidinium massartii, Strain CS-259" /LENGTH=31 /DNA_ID= /DNA_START= /DNA_END= /DNA_ORIENTATION=